MPPDGFMSIVIDYSAQNKEGFNMNKWLVLVSALVLSVSVSAQDQCDHTRSEATWQSTTLFALTYECIPTGWELFFNDADIKAEVKKISDKLQKEIQLGDDVNPAIGNVFRALYSVPPGDIKAIILGQDPAPTKGQATGLAFSLAPGIPSYKVASVERVILEAENEGYRMNLLDGDLSAWAGQGVLMLNTALTIPCKKSKSSCTIAGHLTLWKIFSKKLLGYVDGQSSAQAFILWGDKAAKFSSSVQNVSHLVIKGGHPSPMSNGSNFFCKSYFTCSNKWLEDHNISKIKWEVGSGPALPQACVWTSGKTPKCKSTCTPIACN